MLALAISILLPLAFTLFQVILSRFGCFQPVPGFSMYNFKQVTFFICFFFNGNYFYSFEDPIFAKLNKKIEYLEYNVRNQSVNNANKG